MEHTQTQDSAVKNSKSRDNGAKLIFSDPILCAEFLRGYVDIDLLKEVQPEDISERFLPMWQEGRDSDSVKKIHLKDSVYLSDILGTYIPSFEYLVVPLTNYSNLDLIKKKDELSLLFLINKLRSSSDFKELQNLPPEYFESLSRNPPEYLLELISKILAVFLYRLNIQRKEVEHFTDQI